jgi:hypothetical protein
MGLDRIPLKTGVLCAALVGATMPSYAITNGDFSSGLSGWTSSGTSVTTEAVYHGVGGTGDDANVNYFAAFGGGNISDYNFIFQQFATTANQLYKLTFSYGGFGQSSVQKLTVQTSAAAPTSYSVDSWGTNFSNLFKTVTMYFTATSSQTSLTFSNFSLPSDNADILLANVSVTAVPGPVAAAGLPALLALAGFGLFGRRRRTQA